MTGDSGRRTDVQWRRTDDDRIEGTMGHIPDTPQPEPRAGFLGTTGGRALIAAGVLILVAAGVVAASYLVRPSGSPVAGTATPTPSAIPSAAASHTPPATAAPTASPTPASAELPSGPGDAVMSFVPRCDVVPPVVAPATTVLEDGRVIWRTDDGTFLVRQLTPDSLDGFREQVLSTGLFEQSATYELELLPGAEPPGHGGCLWGFTFTGDDGETVEVSSVNWQGDEEEATYYQPAPERQALDELAQQLLDPAAWNGDEGWVQPDAVPFEPDEYMVLASVSVPQLATQGAPDFDAISWPFDAPPDEFGVDFGFADPPERCDTSDAETIEALADELAAAGLEQFEERPISGAGVGLPWGARDAAVGLSIWTVLPDGRPGCATLGS
jgi:hypothetical protein